MMDFNTRSIFKAALYINKYIIVDKSHFKTLLIDVEDVSWKRRLYKLELERDCTQNENRPVS